jgi:hypothetical protein
MRYSMNLRDTARHATLSESILFENSFVENPLRDTCATPRDGHGVSA